MSKKLEKIVFLGGLMWFLCFPSYVSISAAQDSTPEWFRLAFNETAASWSQAFGTILAIGGTAYFAVRENDRDRYRRKEIFGEQQIATRHLAQRLTKIADDRLRATTLAFAGDTTKIEPAAWAIIQRTVEADLAVMNTLNLHNLEATNDIQTFALISGLMRSTCDFLQPLAQGSIEGKASHRLYIQKAARGIAEIQDEVSRLANKLQN